MQMRCRASAGTAASASWGIVTVEHQHRSLLAAPPHSLGLPQTGHTSARLPAGTRAWCWSSPVWAIATHSVAGLPAAAAAGELAGGPAYSFGKALPRLWRCGSSKDLRVDDLGQNPESRDNSRTRAIETPGLMRWNVLE